QRRGRPRPGGRSAGRASHPARLQDSQHLSMRRIVFRADGDARMGTGHLARCLVLARACETAGWDVTFVTAETSERALFRESGFQGQVLKVPDDTPGSLVSRAGKIEGALVVLDGYHFDIRLE